MSVVVSAAVAFFFAVRNYKCANIFHDNIFADFINPFPVSRTIIFNKTVSHFNLLLFRRNGGAQSQKAPPAGNGLRECYVLWNVTKQVGGGGGGVGCIVS